MNVTGASTFASGLNISGGLNVTGASTFSSGLSVTGNINQNQVSIGTGAGTQGSDSIAIGNNARSSALGASSVAVGPNAGQTNQYNSAIAIGNLAGNNNQYSFAVAVGYQSGYTDQGSYSVAIGSQAGNSFQGSYSVAIGNNAGFFQQKDNAIAIGKNAGQSTQGTNSIAIGYNAGTQSQHQNTIIINASSTALNSSNTNACYISPIRNVTQAEKFSSYLLIYNSSGEIVRTTIGYSFTQNESIVFPNDSISSIYFGNPLDSVLRIIGIGTNGSIDFYNNLTFRRFSSTNIQSGSSTTPITFTNNGITINGGITMYDSNNNIKITNNKPATSIAIGYYAGNSLQGTNTVAIGVKAGFTSQTHDGIAIGNNAGYTSQAMNSIAIGYYAGYYTQGQNSISIGYQAGLTKQNVDTIAIGYQAGQENQYNEAIAIGYLTGQLNQGTRAIAIGNNAGQTNQSSYSIAIGHQAGIMNQPQYTTIINATGGGLSPGINDPSNALYIAPIRSNDNLTNTYNLRYNTTTKEITYNSTSYFISSPGNISNLTNTAQNTIYTTTTLQPGTWVFLLTCYIQNSSNGSISNLHLYLDNTLAINNNSSSGLCAPSTTAYIPYNYITTFTTSATHVFALFPIWSVAPSQIGTLNIIGYRIS